MKKSYLYRPRSELDVCPSESSRSNLFLPLRGPQREGKMDNGFFVKPFLPGLQVGFLSLCSPTFDILIVLMSTFWAILSRDGVC